MNIFFGIQILVFKKFSFFCSYNIWFDFISVLHLIVSDCLTSQSHVLNIDNQTKQKNSQTDKRSKKLKIRKIYIKKNLKRFCGQHAFRTCVCFATFKYCIFSFFVIFLLPLLGWRWYIYKEKQFQVPFHVFTWKSCCWGVFKTIKYWETNNWKKKIK